MISFRTIFFSRIGGYGISYHQCSSPLVIWSLCSKRHLAAGKNKFSINFPLSLRIGKQDGAYCKLLQTNKASGQVHSTHVVISCTEYDKQYNVMSIRFSWKTISITTKRKSKKEKQLVVKIDLVDSYSILLYFVYFEQPVWRTYTLTINSQSTPVFCIVPCVVSGPFWSSVVEFLITDRIGWNTTLTMRISPNKSRGWFFYFYSLQKGAIISNAGRY